MAPDLISPDVRVVIVTFNSADVIAKCLASLESDVECGLAEVVVVDNVSTDATCEIVDSFHWVHLIRSQSNNGFGAGNNQGAAGASADYLFFLNPDSIVKEDVIRSLMGLMDSNSSIACCGPAIQNERGEIELSSFRFTTPLTSVWIALGLQRLAPLNRINGRLGIGSRPPSTTCDVDRVLGAAMMMRRKLFEDEGGFDENFFLYSEEEDLCLRLNLHGGKTVYHPHAVVFHIGAHSTGEGSSLAMASSVWSRQFFLKKHYGRIPAAASRVVWIFSLACKYLLSLLLSTFKSRRRAYRDALYSLLSDNYYQRRIRPISQRSD